MSRMKRCLRLLVCLLSVALPAAAGATTFGAEVGSEFTNQVRGESSPTDVMTDLSALFSAGGRVGRADSDWAAAEPKAPVRGHHTYDWTHDDLIVSEMASARLRWEPTLAFAPRWAEVHRSRVLHLRSGRAIARLPPARNATFAAYATAFMRRYGPHGAFWKANPDLSVCTRDHGRGVERAGQHPRVGRPHQPCGLRANVRDGPQRRPPRLSPHPRHDGWARVG